MAPVRPPFQIYSPYAQSMEIQPVALEGTPPTQPYEAEPPLVLPADVEGDGFLLPILRFPPVSNRHDTVIFNPDFTPISVHGATCTFIQEELVLKKHAMRFIDCGPFFAGRQIVAITRDGKHVVWQQAIRSCVPTAISMLALDRGKTFLSEEISYPVTNNEVMLRQIRKAGFEPKRHPLTGFSMQKLHTLAAVLARTGPGLLHLKHPDLESHMVVLDEISGDYLTVRDPYHGMMLSIKIYPFINWIGDEFIECSEPS